MAVDKICFEFRFNGIECSIIEEKKDRYIFSYGYHMEKYNFYMINGRKSYVCERKIADIVYFFILRSDIINKLEAVYDDDEIRLLGDVRFSVDYNSYKYDFMCPNDLMRESWVLQDLKEFSQDIYILFDYLSNKENQRRIIIRE